MDSPPASQGGTSTASEIPFDKPTPALVNVYAHKPLPPLPPPSHLNRRASRLSKPPTERGEHLCRPRSGTVSDLNSTAPIPIHAQPSLRSHASHGRQTSSSGLSATRRRSSYKVQQLTGFDIDIENDHLYLGRSVDSDASSYHNAKGDGELSLVPLLEFDDGDTSSRSSSWAPMSPESAVMPAPLSASKLAMGDVADSKLGGGLSPGIGTYVDEKPAQSWDPVYRHFSDSMVANEYHRVSVELAMQPARQARTERHVSPAPAGRKRSSLGLSLSASSRFARWRSTPPRAIDSAMPSLSRLSLVGGSHHKEGARPPEQPPASPLPAKAAPVSAFDADSDGEAGSRIKEWFGGNSSERPARSSHGEQMRELLHHAKDRAKMLHMSKDERRREELRRQIRVVQP